MKLVKQSNGTVILFGIYADTEAELQEWHNLFFNFGMTDADLNVESDRFGWFAVSTERAMHGAVQIALNHILRNAKHGLEFKGRKLGAMPLARRAARLWLASIPSERIMPERDLSDVETEYVCGHRANFPVQTY